MNYPIWEVPLLGGGWVIGLIAIVHVYVSHFAIGTGFFLVYTEWKCYQSADARILAYVRHHSRFFVLLSLVTGALTGVGIWFAIGLVHPAATSALIHQFVFVWAIEWAVFLVEIASALIYYAAWERLSARQHMLVGWIYAVSAFASMIAINGILTFMLTPGHWLETRQLWDAFFNPTNWPSLALRFLVTLAIAGLFALVTAARWPEEADRVRLLRYAAKWLLPAYFLLPFLLLWYLSQVPQTALEALQSGIATVGVGTLAVLTRAAMVSIVISATVGLFAYLGPYLNPRNFSFPMAIIFLFLGLVVTGTTEWSREMLRKPYVIYGYMYSNGLLAGQEASYNQQGVLAQAKWASVRAVTAENQLAAGGELFRLQCASCHTRRGYRSMHKVLKGRDIDSLRHFLNSLADPAGPYRGIMPRLVGTPAEQEALARYLLTLSTPARTR